MNEAAVIMGKGVIGLGIIISWIVGVFLVTELLSNWTSRYKWLDISLTTNFVLILIFGLGALIHYGGF